MASSTPGSCENSVRRNANPCSPRTPRGHRERIFSSCPSRIVSREMKLWSHATLMPCSDHIPPQKVTAASIVTLLRVSTAKSLPQLLIQIRPYALRIPSTTHTHTHAHIHCPPPQGRFFPAPLLSSFPSTIAIDRKGTEINQ